LVRRWRRLLAVPLTNINYSNSKPISDNNSYGRTDAVASASVSTSKRRTQELRFYDVAHFGQFQCTQSAKRTHCHTRYAGMSAKGQARAADSLETLLRSKLANSRFTSIALSEQHVVLCTRPSAYRVLLNKARKEQLQQLQLNKQQALTRALCDFFRADSLENAPMSVAMRALCS
jgi:hypothetical protein